VTASSSSGGAPRVNRWTRDDWAQQYLASRGSIPFRRQAYEVLMELFDGRAVARVLDLGTGDGYTLGLVLGMHPGAQGVGLDFNDEMLRLAADRFGGRSTVEIVRHDLDEPLPELGMFDVIVSSFAIHHCAPARQRALYAEVFARLTPGGLFANLEHVDSPTPERHREFLSLIGVAEADDDPSNQLVEPEVQLGWLRDIGFAQVECLWKWRELALLVGVHP
jgi:SAM-dependent methyltransferase